MYNPWPLILIVILAIIIGKNVFLGYKNSKIPRSIVQPKMKETVQGERYDNNRDEYRSKCTVFTGLMAGGLVLLGCILYGCMLHDDPDGIYIIVIAVVAAIVFATWQLAAMHSILGIPENEADRITKPELARDWSTIYGVSFGAVYACVMLVGTLSRGDLEGALPAIVVGCPVLGVIAYFIAMPVAKALAPEEYRPWLTQAGYQAYVRRLEERRMRATIQAAQIEARMRDTAVSPTPDAATPPTPSAPSSAIKGRIYQGRFSGPEIGYYTQDKIYNSTPLIATKVGSYRDGLIDDDSGVFLKNTIGRYVWSDVGYHPGYELFSEADRHRCVGRVLRNGEIQKAKHPSPGAVSGLLPTEYTTIARYSGDPEGAAAAAYLLLFR